MDTPEQDTPRAAPVYTIIGSKDSLNSSQASPQQGINPAMMVDVKSELPVSAGYAPMVVTN